MTYKDKASYASSPPASDWCSPPCRALRPIFDMNGTCHVYGCVMSHTYEWVMSTHKNGFLKKWDISLSAARDRKVCGLILWGGKMCRVMYVNESCHTCEWVMSHMWMSHVTRVNGSCMWMSHVTRVNDSCHARMNESCHTWMSRVTRCGARPQRMWAHFRHICTPIKNIFTLT